MIVLPLAEQAMLTTLLSQPHRYYHNINHINFCLGELEKCDVNHMTRRIVTYAIWYHDAVYNPYSVENELQSEELFYRQHRTPTIFSFEEFDAIGRAVRATASHTTHQYLWDDYPTQLMLDIDLAGLGQSWENFDHNSEMIRLEYAHIDDETFTYNRIKFLGAIKSRPTIYYTKHFYDKYEAIAQSNVDIELKRLEAL
jgi:predicted metal-dependent HD superfamily phosphohydrolase